MGTLRRDLIYALRSLGRAPGFAAVAILTLAIGIGANTAMFSVLSPMLLEPLPYPQAERIIEVEHVYHGQRANGLTGGEALYLAEHQRALAATAIVDANSNANLAPGKGSGDAAARAVVAQRVSHGYFDVMGVQPARGRGFSAADDQPGAPGVAILSDGLWRSQFAGNPGILGQTIRLDSAVFTVIGVMPASFVSLTQNQLVPEAPQIWTAMQPTEAGLAPLGPNLDFLGRLAPGRSLAQAQADLDFQKAAFDRLHPRYAQVSWGAVGYQSAINGDSRAPLLLLLGAVGLVLLIACANLANLLLARATGRRREMAIRAALGANSRRLLRQLLTESLLLAGLGAAGGWLLAWWSAPLLRAATPTDYALPLSGRLDGWALAFTLGLAVATGLLFGLAPAWHASRLNLQENLKEGSGAGTSRGSGRARSALVVAEVALAFVLLAGATLLGASLLHLRQVHPGFDTHHVLTVQTTLAGPRAASDAATARYTQQVVDQLERIPGVAAAASITGVPLTRAMNWPMLVRGHAEDEFGDNTEWRAISPDYFQALGIALVAGRAFTAGDTAANTPVAIVSAGVARHYWPGRSALGQMVETQRGPDIWAEVVGVAADVRENGVDEDAPATLYVPQAQAGDGINALVNHWFPMGFVVRGRGGDLAAAVRRAFAAVDAEQPVFHVRSLEEIQGTSLGRYDFMSLLLGLFAALALGLGGIGIYGVLAYTVAQRRREIGLRMALGADRGHILRQFVGQALGLAGLGLGLGAAGALLLTGLLSGFLFGVGATDPRVLAGVGVVLLALAGAASLQPAWRATRVDPLEALRS